MLRNRLLWVELRRLARRALPPGHAGAPLIEAGKLGPVLWQLPPSFHRDDARLGAALNALPDGRHAFEFRHASWFC